METHGPIPLLRTRLSVQMFLQFAIWGAWAPVLAQHMNAALKFDGGQIGMVYLSATLASVVSPLIAGQIADRWMPTQIFLGLSYLLSAGIYYYAASVTDFKTLCATAFAAMFFFSPTLGLGNSLCFHHLKDPQGDFPKIRVFGTFGWIGAGWILGWWMQYNNRPIGDCLYLAAVFSVINGIYSFTLPHTPPAKKSASSGSGGDGKSAIGKVLGMLADPSFLIFSLVAMFLLVCAAPYYNFSSMFFGEIVAAHNISKVLSIGQIVEIATMFILPFALKKLGMKTTIILGLAAWALRFGIYAIGQPEMLVMVAQGLHGFCFAFAIAAAMIYVEQICEPDIRGTMQSFLGFLTYGVGMAIGTVIGGQWLKMCNVDGKYDWHKFWMAPTIGCVAAILLFLVGFKARAKREDDKAAVGSAAVEAQA